ncbi:nucleotide kinase [Shigella phage CT02]|uniref:Nucleotide kinase n=1 Tax=Shigella phage CT02 TaxID=3003584 RepID=A0A9E9ERK9_9CAUD|nr:nucleotide kinase [Shigella phage CT02]
MLQHHWNKPDLEARFPVNSAVRYSGDNPVLKGLTGTVQGYSHTGRVKVRFGVREAEVHPSVLIPLPKVGPNVEAPKSAVKSDVTNPNISLHTSNCKIWNGANRCTCEPASDDGVKQPRHYQLFDNVEAIEVIARSMTVEAFRGYCLGNILKYRLRAGKKSELATMEKDLNKAAFYQELFDKHRGLCYDAS